MSLTSRFDQLRHGNQPADADSPQVPEALPPTLSRIQEAKAADAAHAALVVQEAGPNAGMASEALRGLK
ncbi:MAG TPA: hypothetical protein VF885_06900, partial [Arthrobacter sp.]